MVALHILQPDSNQMADVLVTTSQRKKRYTDALFAKLTLRIIQVNRASSILFMARKYSLIYSSILGSIVPGPRQADAYSLFYTSFLGSIVPGRK